MKKSVSRLYMVMGILFCVCLVVSNFFETKPISLGFVDITAGMLLFPVSYIINDCITEVWGFREAKFIILMGFAVNFFVLLLSVAAVSIPAPSWWKNGDAFDFVFGLAPRITVASLTAFLTGSFLNAWVMARMKAADGERRFSLRAIASTLVGEGADSLVFFPIAFAGVMPVKELLTMMAVQATLKTLYEVIVLPLTIHVVRHLKKVEWGSEESNSDKAV